LRNPKNNSAAKKFPFFVPPMLTLITAKASLQQEDVLRLEPGRQREPRQ
jgi:hypothetical protein